MSKPLLQDSQQLEKPHLLPWMEANATKEKEGEKILKDRNGGEDGLAGSSSVGVWGCQAEEGNRSRITSEGLCVSVKPFSLSQKPLNRLTDLL